MLTLARQQQRQNIRWLLCLSVLMLLALLLSLCAGEQWISPGDWFTPRGELFVWQIRLPRTLAVLLVGAALAISGAVMQALFENPLAEPGLLGVSNGAGVGLIAAVLLGQGQLPNWALGLCAIAGALIITLILLRFARRHLSTSRLLLAGVALGIICSALMTWAIYFSTSVDLRQLMYWMMGGFGGVDWRQSWLMLALIPVLLWICCQSRPMNMLALGEISARQLGLPLWFWRNVLVAATGWMVGVSVALAGAIGRELLALCPGFACLDEYRARCFVPGHWVTVCTGTETYAAQALSIDDVGRLVVQREGGRTEALRCGEVTIRPTKTE